MFKFGFLTPSRWRQLIAVCKRRCGAMGDVRAAAIAAFGIASLTLAVPIASARISSPALAQGLAHRDGLLRRRFCRRRGRHWYRGAGSGAGLASVGTLDRGLRRLARQYG